MICDRLKSKRRVFAELRLVRGFIRANASQMSCGRSQNLLYATPSGSKISPPLFVKFHHHKVSVLNDYLCVKKEIFQFYFIWSQIDQFKKDDSILSWLCSRQTSCYFYFILFCFNFFISPYE